MRYIFTNLEIARLQVLRVGILILIFLGNTGRNHHSGDLPNITTDKNGVAEFTYETKAFTLIPSPYSILGRSVIIHMQHDDYMSQPAGNAGDRIACGIIGVVK